jgi:hypothetical protein
MKYYSMLTHQGKKLKKKSVPGGYNYPFLNESNINYLIKMKTDTSHFNSL